MSKAGEVKPSLPATASPRLLCSPLLWLAALPLLAFDPGWLDFEQARRAWLWIVVGATALLLPQQLAARPPGQRWLELALTWAVVSAVGNAPTLAIADTAMQLAQGLALLLLCRLGATTGALMWSRLAVFTLAPIAALGILQRFDLLALGGTPTEPTSLFGNRNVAAEVVAIAGAAACASFAAHRRLATAALVVGAAYAVVNGSRSALVALPLAALFVGVLGRDRAPADRWLPSLWLALGAALGLGLASLAPTRGDGTQAIAPQTRTATVAVRLEIAKAGLKMAGEAPLLGHGPGQFAVQYPRFRTQAEIELSSLGRNEQRRVTRAHNDWLELAIDGGLPMLLLVLAYAVTRWRTADDRAGLAPLFALAALMVVRAPLCNAPAVALALLTASGPALATTPLRRSNWMRMLGLLLLGLGLVVATAASLVGRYVNARGAAPRGPGVWLERATAAWPFEPTTWQLLAQEQQAASTDRHGAELALIAIERAIHCRPHEPSYLLQRADLLRLCGRFAEAKLQLAEVARLDPGEPQVNLQLAGIYFTEQNIEGAIAALCTAPPPSLRTALQTQLLSFAALAQQQGDHAGSRRFLAEAAFVRALDATGEPGRFGRAVADAHLETMRLAFVAAGLQEHDLRWFVIAAIHANAQGDVAKASSLAQTAAQPRRQLLTWQWSLLAPRAAPLRALADWRAILPTD